MPNAYTFQGLHLHDISYQLDVILINQKRKITSQFTTIKTALFLSPL